MDNFILLVACFVIGMLLRRSGRLPDNAHAALNGFVIHVSLPALTLLYVHDLKLDLSLLFPVAMAWVMFGVGFVFFKMVGKIWALPAGTVGALTLTGSLANTSFIGLPMIETFYGPARSRARHPDRSDGHVHGALDPGHLGRRAVRAGRRNKRASGSDKGADVCAVCRLPDRVVADPRALPRLGSPDFCDGSEPRWYLWPSCRSGTRSNGARFAASSASSRMGLGFKLRGRACHHCLALCGPARGSRREHSNHDFRGGDGAADRGRDRRGRP